MVDPIEQTTVGTARMGTPPRGGRGRLCQRDKVADSPASGRPARRNGGDGRCMIRRRHAQVRPKVWVRALALAPHPPMLYDIGQAVRQISRVDVCGPTPSKRIGALVDN